MKELKNVILKTNDGLEFVFNLYADGLSVCLNKDCSHLYEMPYLLVFTGKVYKVYKCAYLRYSFKLKECIYGTNRKSKAVSYLQDLAVKAMNVRSFILR